MYVLIDKHWDLKQFYFVTKAGFLTCNSASNLNIYTINTGTKINHKILIFRTNTCISVLRNMKLTNFDTERQYYTLHFDWCSI